MFENDKKKSFITSNIAGIIKIRIKEPKHGLKRKLMVNTFTCGAVFEIMPSMISCPKVARSTGDAICSPIYKTFDVIFTR